MLIPPKGIKITICLLFTSILAFGQKETIRVLHVDGNVKFGNEKKLLKVGMKFEEHPTIYFSNDEETVILWSVNTREIYISPKIDSISGKLNLKLNLKKILSQKRTDMFSRGDRDRIRYLIISDGKLIKDKKLRVFIIPKNTESYYFLCHKDDTLQKHKLLVDRNKLTSISEAVNSMVKDGETEFVMGYHDASENKTTYYESLRFKVIELNLIKEELSLLSKWNKELGYNKNDLKNSLKNYIKKVYGNNLKLSEIEF